MNRLNAYSASPEQITEAEHLIDSLTLIELSPTVLKRALEPWPMPIRTLDALHLATALYLTEQNTKLTLATYDHRMAGAANGLGLAVVEPA